MSSGVPISSQAAPQVAQPSVSAGLRWSGRILERARRIVPGLRQHRQRDEGFQCARGKRSARPLGETYRRDRGHSGAILLTGDLAIQLHVGNPLFSQAPLPVYFGVLVWVGLYFREARLRAASLRS